jgi:hypothetical protein
MTRITRGGIALALCIGALTACAGQAADKQKPPGVITFSEPAAGASGAAATNPDAGRPQLRLDMTEAEENALFAAHSQCLKDAGVPMNRDEHGQLWFASDEAKRMATSPEVLKACGGKEPLKPPEMDPDKNPYYEEDRLANIKCQIEHGIPWQSNGGKYDYPPDITDPAQLQIQRDCRLRHMNGKRG